MISFIVKVVLASFPSLKSRGKGLVSAVCTCT